MVVKMVRLRLSSSSRIVLNASFTSTIENHSLTFSYSVVMSLFFPSELASTVKNQYIMVHISMSLHDISIKKFAKEEISASSSYGS